MFANGVVTSEALELPAQAVTASDLSRRWDRWQLGAYWTFCFRRPDVEAISRRLVSRPYELRGHGYGASCLAIVIYHFVVVELTIDKEGGHSNCYG